jgi:L-ascorbate metabolism protein UlaG (beta-lactamase superfamily)
LDAELVPLIAMSGWLYRRIFPRFEEVPELRPTTRSASGAAVRIRWFGTASHVIETATVRVLIDPFLTRAPLGRLIGRLTPDEAAIRARLPERVDAVLCGHSHFDHLLDAPTIARLTGALLVGSKSTCSFGRASGVTRLSEVPPEGARLTIGDLEVRFVPSLHGRIAFGRVPFPGEVAEAPALPAPAWRYRMGGAFGILLRAPGATVYHNGSADLVDAELEGERADVLLVGLAGRKGTPDYLARLCGALGPSLVVPTHHDAFFAPLDDGLFLLPGIDVPGFLSETRRIAPAARVITPRYDEVLAVPAGAARDAALVA